MSGDLVEMIITSAEYLNRYINYLSYFYISLSNKFRKLIYLKLNTNESFKVSISAYLIFHYRKSVVQHFFFYMQIICGNIYISKNINIKTYIRTWIFIHLRDQTATRERTIIISFIEMTISRILIEESFKYFPKFSRNINEFLIWKQEKQIMTQMTKSVYLKQLEPPKFWLFLFR